MDAAKLSTGDIEPYDADPAFLVDIQDRMLEAARSGGIPATSAATITFRMEPHGTVKRESHDVWTLLQALPASEDCCVEIMVLGPSAPSGNTLVLCATLDPARGSHLYAAGPADICVPAYNTLRAMFADRAIRKTMPDLHDRRTELAAARPKRSLRHSAELAGALHALRWSLLGFSALAFDFGIMTNAHPLILAFGICGIAAWLMIPTPLRSLKWDTSSASRDLPPSSDAGVRSRISLRAPDGAENAHLGRTDVLTRNPT